MATRRGFSREFKLEAVRMVIEQGLSVAEVARDLDIHANLLRGWTMTGQMANPRVMSAPS